MNLVNNHHPVGGRQLFCNATRVLGQGKIGGCLEEIVYPDPLKRVSDQRSLTRLPGTEQEVGLLFNQTPEIKRPVDVSGILGLSVLRHLSCHIS